MNGQSSRGRYVLVALIGAAVGGVTVALSTQAVPRLMSKMEDTCKQMMAGMNACGGEAEGKCQQMAAEKEQASNPAACHSEGGSCHGSD